MHYVLPFIAIAGGNGTRSLEVTGGAGFTLGPVWASSITYNKVYPVNEYLRLGWGTGVSVNAPVFSLNTYITESGGTKERDTMNEFSVPMYFRLNYGADRLFFNWDIGYSLGLIGLAFEDGSIAAVEPETVFSGLFTEPQIGYRFAESYSVALGLLAHHAVIKDRIYSTTSTSSSGTSVTHSIFTPALTLRLVRHF